MIDVIESEDQLPEPDHEDEAPADDPNLEDEAPDADDQEDGGDD